MQPSCTPSSRIFLKTIAMYNGITGIAELACVTTLFNTATLAEPPVALS